jgi:hypothetical protein
MAMQPPRFVALLTGNGFFKNKIAANFRDKRRPSAALPEHSSNEGINLQSLLFLVAYYL